MIKHKADNEDLIKLKEAKTNKEDSVQHMESIQVFKRMLLHTNQLLIELAKIGVIGKNES